MMGGFFPGFPKIVPEVTNVAPTVEDHIERAQAIVTNWVDNNADLVRQATYQTLYAMGYRIPTDLHGTLVRLARKVKDAT